MNDYNHVKICPVKIPKSGKKLFSLNGINLFVRPLGGLLYFYEVSTGRFLLCIDANRRAEAFEYLLKRENIIREMIDDLLSASMEVPG